MKKYMNFKSKSWALFTIVLSVLISFFAAGCISALIYYCGGEPLTQLQLLAVAICVFFLRMGPAPSGALYANFTFGQASFGTLGDSENIGGLRGYILFCPLFNITTHPALPAVSDSTTSAQSVTATGTYTMVATKVFVTLYGLDDKFKYTAKKIAEKGGAGFEQMLEVEFTGQADALLAFQRLTASIPGVFVCVTPEGTQYIIGNDSWPAWAETSEYTTGAGMKELRNSKIVIKSSSPAPVVKFAGTVPIS